MVVEAPVLGGDHRLGQPGRHVGQGDEPGAVAAAHGQGAAIGGDHRDLRLLALGEQLVGVRQPGRHRQEQHDPGGEPHEQQGRQPAEQPTDEAAPRRRRDGAADLGGQGGPILLGRGTLRTVLTILPEADDTPQRNGPYPRVRQSLLLPDPEDPRLTQPVVGIDQEGREVAAAIVHERPLTLFLNGQEIVTMMTIGDHPDYLALGYLLNQNMLRPGDEVTAVEHDEELEVVVVRTAGPTDFEAKLQKKVRTSGCAQGTAFGDLMERFDEVRLPENAVLRTSWLYSLMRQINTIPSLYLKAGAIHGCALCEADRVLLYMEDVGRHNAVDKIAGYLHRHGLGSRAPSSTPPGGSPPRW